MPNSKVSGKYFFFFGCGIKNKFKNSDSYINWANDFHIPFAIENVNVW